MFLQAHQTQGFQGFLPVGLLQPVLGRQVQNSRENIVIGGGIQSRHHILQNRQALKEPDILEGPGNAQPRDLVLLHAGNVLIPEHHFPGVYRINTGNQVQHGGLPCPVGTDNPNDLSFFYFQGDILYRLYASETLLDRLKLQQHYRSPFPPAAFLSFCGRDRIPLPSPAQSRSKLPSATRQRNGKFPESWSAQCRRK